VECLVNATSEERNGGNYARYGFENFGVDCVGGVIGALIGSIITPFVLYLAYLVAYAIASMMAMASPKKRTIGKRLVRFTQFANPLNDVIHASHCKEHTVSYAKHIPDSREHSNGIVDRDIVCHTPMPQRPSATHYGTPNQNTFDMVNQPAFKKAPTIFHRIILFYRSYYGQSTKVEKNLP
jgi:hypothetical protein